MSDSSDSGDLHEALIERGATQQVQRATDASNVPALSIEARAVQYSTVPEICSALR